MTRDIGDNGIAERSDRDDRAEREATVAFENRLNRRDLLKSLGLTTVVSGGFSETTAAAAVQTTGLTAAFAAVSDGRSGTAVALDGQTAAVGSPSTADLEQLAAADGIPTGDVAVFARTEGAWSRETTLTPTDGMPGGHFGSSVALDGDTLLVGAPLPGGPHVPHQGTATVYTRSTDDWQHESSLDAVDPSGVDRFGDAVAVDGDTLLVGAPAAGSASDGSATVFSRVNGGWQRTAELVAPDGIREFGRAVDLTDGTAVVGARRPSDDTSDGDGVAFVFERSVAGWRRTAELAAETNAGSFGAALAADGRSVLIGAPTETNEAGVDAGGAYAFTRTRRGWREDARLLPGGSDTRRFGTAIAVDSALAVVGSFTGGPATTFARTDWGWTRLRTLSPPDHGRSVPDGAVAVDGSRALVGLGSDHAVTDLVDDTEVFER